MSGGAFRHGGGIRPESCLFHSTGVAPAARFSRAKATS